MKTKLKIHLRDLEAEALARLVYVYDTTPDKLINALIAKEYNDLMSTSATTPPDYKLFCMVSSECFPSDYEETFTQDAENLSAKSIWRIMRAYEWAMDNPTDNELKDRFNVELLDNWHGWRDEFIKKTNGDPYSFFHDPDLDR